ncbi:MAG: helix-turn-helix domain-containing protein [Jatrophihabitantaceae bacterium]
MPAPPIPDRDRPLAERDWLRPGEACRLAGVSYATLVQWRTAGLLPAARVVNGRWRYAGADVRRIRSAPRRGKTGVDRPAVQAMIADNALREPSGSDRGW